MSKLPPLNLLVAYPYVTPGLFKLMEQFNRIGGVRWLLDSGAFTAWKSGKPISLDNYCAFLSDLPVTPWRYFALDVIGDGAATARNYYTMLERGFHPVPVFTRGESLDVLDRYYETSDLVAIGGLVSKTSAPKPYLKYLHKHIAGRAYHALGFSSVDWLKYLKPYSVDSSSWEQAGRYGALCVYMGHGHLANFTRSDLQRVKNKEEIAARMRMLGFEFADLYRPESWRGGLGLTQQITAASWMWLSTELTKKLGTLLFLARSHVSTFLPDAHIRALRAAGYHVAESLRDERIAS